MTELESLLAHIDAMKTRLDAVRPLTNAQMQRALDIEYTYESNRIEGNTLTLRETDLVVNKGLTVGGKSIREHLEAINHYEAILYIRKLATQGKTLEEREIRNIHALVLRAIDRENAGRYRSLPVMIAGSRHLPPQPWAVPKLMEERATQEEQPHSIQRPDLPVFGREPSDRHPAAQERQIRRPAENQRSHP